MRQTDRRRELWTRDSLNSNDKPSVDLDVGGNGGRRPRADSDVDKCVCAGAVSVDQAIDVGFRALKVSLSQPLHWRSKGRFNEQ